MPYPKDDFNGTDTSMGFVWALTLNDSIEMLRNVKSIVDREISEDC